MARKLSHPVARPPFRGLALTVPAPVRGAKAPVCCAVSGPVDWRSVALVECGVVTDPVRGAVNDPLCCAVNKTLRSVRGAGAVPLTDVCPLAAGSFLLGWLPGVILKFVEFLLMRAVSHLSALRKNHRTASLDSGGNFRRRTPSLQHASRGARWQNRYAKRTCNSPDANTPVHNTMCKIHSCLSRRPPSNPFYTRRQNTTTKAAAGPPLVAQPFLAVHAAPSTASHRDHTRVNSSPRPAAPREAMKQSWTPNGLAPADSVILALEAFRCAAQVSRSAGFSAFPSTSTPVGS